MKLNKAAVVVMVSAFLGGFISTVQAQEVGVNGDFVTHRTYVGGFGSSTNIDGSGNFNGNWGFQFSGNSEVDLIPSLDRSFGFGGLVGHREGPYAAEISYWRTNHNGTWSDGSTTYYGTVSYQSINLDIKRYLFTAVPTQPFFSLGVSFPWVVAHNASGMATSSGFEIADMTIAGMGFNLGVGLEIYLGSDFSVLGGATQRWAGYNQINGALKQPFTTELNGQPINVEGDGLNFFVGSTVGFE